MGALRVHAYYDAGANDPAVPAAERRARAGRLSSSSVRVGTVLLPNYELRAGYNELEEQIHFDQSLGVEAPSPPPPPPPPPSPPPPPPPPPYPGARADRPYLRSLESSVGSGPWVVW